MKSQRARTFIRLKKTVVLFLAFTFFSLNLPLHSTSVLAFDPAPIAPDTLGDQYLNEFYEFELSNEKPGELIRYREIMTNELNPGATSGFDILYASQDGLEVGKTVVVSGVLYLPDRRVEKAGWPLIVWSHGTVGIADQCAPSWSGRQEQDRRYLQVWLEAGFAVVASDYQGLGTKGTHPYLATRPAAYSNLDAIRAVVSEPSFDLSGQTILVGQSQGASAALATLGTVKDYAPTLSVMGAVLTGVPYFRPDAMVNLMQSRPKDRIDPMLGYNLLALTVVQMIDQEFFLEDYINSEFLEIAKSVQTTCHKDVKAKVIEAQLTYNNLFKRAPTAPLERAFSLFSYPSFSLPAPIFIGVGAKDRDTPVYMQAALAKTLCDNGTSVHAMLYPEYDHKSVVLPSVTDSLMFVQSIMTDTLGSSDCGALPF